MESHFFKRLPKEIENYRKKKEEYKRVYEISKKIEGKIQPGGVGGTDANLPIITNKLEAAQSFLAAFHRLEQTYSRFYEPLKDYGPYKREIETMRQKMDKDEQYRPSMERLQEMYKHVDTLYKQIASKDSEEVVKNITNFVNEQKESLKRATKFLDERKLDIDDQKAQRRMQKLFEYAEKKVKNLDQFKLASQVAKASEKPFRDMTKFEQISAFEKIYEDEDFTPSAVQRNFKALLEAIQKEMKDQLAVQKEKQQIIRDEFHNVNNPASGGKQSLQENPHWKNLHMALKAALEEVSPKEKEPLEESQFSADALFKEYQTVVARNKELFSRFEPWQKYLDTRSGLKEEIDTLKELLSNTSSSGLSESSSSSDNEILVVNTSFQAGTSASHVKETWSYEPSQEEKGKFKEHIETAENLLQSKEATTKDLVDEHHKLTEISKRWCESYLQRAREAKLSATSHFFELKQGGIDIPWNTSWEELEKHLHTFGKDIDEAETLLNKGQGILKDFVPRYEELRKMEEEFFSNYRAMGKHMIGNTCEEISDYLEEYNAKKSAIMLSSDHLAALVKEVKESLEEKNPTSSKKLDKLYEESQYQLRSNQEKLSRTVQSFKHDVARARLEYEVKTLKRSLGQASKYYKDSASEQLTLQLLMGEAERTLDSQGSTQEMSEMLQMLTTSNKFNEVKIIFEKAEIEEELKKIEETIKGCNKYLSDQQMLKKLEPFSVGKKSIEVLRQANEKAQEQAEQARQCFKTHGSSTNDLQATALWADELGAASEALKTAHQDLTKKWQQLQELQSIGTNSLSHYDTAQALSQKFHTFLDLYGEKDISGLMTSETRQALTNSVGKLDSCLQKVQQDLENGEANTKTALQKIFTDLRKDCEALIELRKMIASHAQDQWQEIRGPYSNPDRILSHLRSVLKPILNNDGDLSSSAAKSLLKTVTQVSSSIKDLREWFSQNKVSDDASIQATLKNDQENLEKLMIFFESINETINKKSEKSYHDIKKTQTELDESSYKNNWQEESKCMHVIYRWNDKLDKHVNTIELQLSLLSLKKFVRMYNKDIDKCNMEWTKKLSKLNKSLNELNDPSKQTDDYLKETTLDSDQLKQLDKDKDYGSKIPVSEKAKQLNQLFHYLDRIGNNNLQKSLPQLRNSYISDFEIYINIANETNETINNSINGNKDNKLLIEISNIYTDFEKSYEVFKAFIPTARKENEKFKALIPTTQEHWKKFLDHLKDLVPMGTSLLYQARKLSKQFDKVQKIGAFVNKSTEEQKMEIEKILADHDNDRIWLKVLKITENFQDIFDRFASSGVEHQKQVQGSQERSKNQKDILASPIALFERVDKLQDTIELRKDKEFDACVNDFVQKYQKSTDQQPSLEDLNKINKAYTDALFQSQLAFQPELVPTISHEELMHKIKELDDLNIKPYTLAEYISGGKNQHVIWSVGRDGKLLLAPKKHKDTEISHALMRQDRPLVAAGEAIIFYHNYTGESYLIDINSKSSCYHTDDRSIEIGKAAFKHNNTPLREDILKSLNHHDTHLEQTYPVLPVSSETLLASKQAQDLWTRLEDSQSNQRLKDVSIKISDKPKTYTKQEKERVQRIVDLAAELWPLTKDIRDQFNITILPGRSSDVVYAGEDNLHLCIPVEGEPLKLVLSTIRGIMDRPKYGWDCKVEDSEDYAQDAATAISLIEACRKLDQPMPSDLPPLGELKLDFLAEEYNLAYTKTENTEQSQQDAARQHIYDIYAEHLWAILKHEKGNLRLQDTSLVEGKDYTREMQERARMTYELAAILSPTTKKFNDWFNMPIDPCRNDDVAYDSELSRMHVPADAQPLKTVLSIIEKMDHAVYEWAGAREGHEKYAQDAATAIRQIEAWFKLNQPLGDLPENLQSLAKAYKEAYTNAELTIEQQDTARLCIYGIYKDKYNLERLHPPRVDTRNYKVCDPKNVKIAEDRLSFKEKRWRLSRNLYPKLLRHQVETCKRFNVKPAKWTKKKNAHFDEIIKQGRVIYIISAGDQIIVAPRKIENTGINHAAVANGKPVLAAGEVEICKRGENDYVVLDISPESGHFRAKEKLGYAITIFLREGFHMRSLG